MVNRFLGEELPLVHDTELRSKAALWGSPATITALAEWQQAITDIKASVGATEGKEIDLTLAQSAMLKDRLGAAIVAMRLDLSPVEETTKVTTETALASIFNEKRL